MTDLSTEPTLIHRKSNDRDADKLAVRSDQDVVSPLL